MTGKSRPQFVITVNGIGKLDIRQFASINQIKKDTFTDAPEKDYTRQITGILKEYRAEMIAKDTDPTQRITNLENGSTATDDAEAAEVKAEAAKVAAIALTTTLRENNHKLAQASVGLIEGAPGKEHPAFERTRGIRSSMSHSVPNPPTPPPRKRPACKRMPGGGMEFSSGRIHRASGKRDGSYCDFDHSFVSVPRRLLPIWRFHF